MLTALTIFMATAVAPAEPPAEAQGQRWPGAYLLLGGEPAVDVSVPGGLAPVRVRVFVGVRF